MGDRLKGKVAVVTGSSRNIGKAIAVALARDGADVVVNARQSVAEAEATARELQERFGVRSLAVQANCADHEQVRRLAGVVLERFGRVDILVNNVGIAPMVPFLEMTDEDWDTVLRVSLSSAFYCTREFIAGMVERRWGRVVNIGGQAGIRGTWGKAHNAAAKHGLIGFTHAIATEFAPYNITCNHVGPGHIATSERVPYYRDRRAEVAPGWHEMWAERIPMKRNGAPEEVAAVVAFLAGEEASYVTGQTILVNGGMYYT